MHTNEKATAACRAAMTQTDALSWQAAHPFFRPTRRGAQIHAAHLMQLQRAARIALANVADQRTPLAGIVEDSGRVLSLYGRASR